MFHEYQCCSSLGLKGLSFYSIVHVDDAEIVRKMHVEGLLPIHKFYTFDWKNNMTSQRYVGKKRAKFISRIRNESKYATTSSYESFALKLRLILKMARLNTDEDIM